MTLADWFGYRPAREGYWFVPKRFGLGATPVTWQGWAVTLGYVPLLFAAIRWMPTRDEKVIAGAGLTLALLAIGILKTDGQWRWRWGADR